MLSSKFTLFISNFVGLVDIEINSMSTLDSYAVAPLLLGGDSHYIFCYQKI
jgi:hypothetical protein